MARKRKSRKNGMTRKIVQKWWDVAYLSTKKPGPRRHRRAIRT